MNIDVITNDEDNRLFGLRTSREYYDEGLVSLIEIGLIFWTIVFWDVEKYISV